MSRPRWEGTKDEQETVCGVAGFPSRGVQNTSGVSDKGRDPGGLRCRCRGGKNDGG